MFMCCAKLSSSVLVALATLGNATQIEPILICIMPPMEAKASRGGNDTMQYH